MSSAVRNAAEARIGTLLDGKWTLDKLLGYGGSAAVYASTHRNGKRAAVKVLHAHCAADPDLVARFVREGYLANKIEHPGVVSVLDDDTSDDGIVYLVMELLDGRSFERQIRGTAPPLSIADALHVADDLLDILVKAHAVGLVHRDIKPANIFLTASGQLKILDFGIARLAESFSGDGVTQTGMLMGTPAYMPPEQARGRWQEVDGRSDIWAVGVTVSSLLTGKRPRSADTPAEELLAAMMNPLPSLATMLPTAPTELVRILDKASAFERNDRWENAAEMQAAVRALRLSLYGTTETMPSSHMTVALARDGHSSPPFGDSPRDPTPPPTGQQGVFYGSTLLQPQPSTLLQPNVPRPNMALSQEPEPLPSLTTHRAMMMRSNLEAGSAPPPPKSKVGVFIGIAALLGVIGLVGIGATIFVRNRHATVGSEQTPVTTTAPTAIAPPATTTTAAALADEADAGATTSAAPSSAQSAQTEQRKKDSKKPKPPKPGGDAPVDPSKLFENRNQ